MIVRRLGTWGTMNGEGTDDDNSVKRIGMSGFQQQQVKAVESSQAGSSGSSSSSSGWGTCSELLLVSAVKKHGVPSWNLVASELKARAVVLNISPSCFTEEACKFKYKALKGKYASSSSSGGGGSVSSPDDDLDGVSWFEELRKLRMSHLKEELQVYDSSIGQLQSRITTLQEERVQCLSHQSLMNQYDSNCRLIDTNRKDSKSSDKKAPSPICHCEKSLETSQDSALTNAAQAALPAESLPIINTDDVDQPKSFVMELVKSEKDSPDSFTPQPTGQESSGEVERGADLTLGKSMPSASHAESPETVARQGEEDQVGPTTPNEEALQVREDEIMGKEEQPDLEMSTSTSDQAVVAEPSEAPRGAVGDVIVRGDGIDPAVPDDFGTPENEGSEGFNEKPQGNDSEPDITVSTSYPPPGSPSTSTAVVNPEDVSGHDPGEAVGVTSADSPSRAPEAEASNSRDSSKVDSISKREPRLSRLSLSHGRAEKEKRLKAKEEGKLKRMSEEVREVEDGQPSERTVAAEADILLLEEKKDVKDTSVVSLVQSENGRILPCDPSPVDEMGAGSVKQDVVPDSLPPAIGDGTNNAMQCSGLGNESNSVDAGVRPSDMDVLQASSDLVSSRDAEPRSPEDDVPLLTVALGPDPTDHAEEPRPPVITPQILERRPDPESEQEVSHEDNLKHEEAAVQPQTPNEGKSLSGKIPAETDGKSEVVPREANDVMMESEIVEVGQDEEDKVDEVDMVAAQGEEGETLEITDVGNSRSVGEDVPETLDTKGSETGQGESRDGPETGEVQQPFPDYTDSQIDKSEVGSSMDSIEDMSPSNRKNRREPKVPGKFLPLLECLRVICGHKFAPLFRQRQEYQDNSEYDRLVRRHVDLSMVRARLEDGAYSGSVEFFRDLLLIFTNALVYNSSDSQEHVGAKALRSCALTEMDKILQTEALLKQNGPATRKREVRKSMEVHKARVSSFSAGSEARKKGILRGSTDAPATLDNSPGGAKSAHIAFNDTPHAGRSSNNNDVDRDLDVKIETTLKKAPANRIVKEETPRKESQRPEFLNVSGNRSASGGTVGKMVKLDRDALKTGLQGQVLADIRASGGRLNVESLGTKTAPAKTKDVICIDLEEKVTPNSSSSVVPSGLPVEKQRTTPIFRQTSTSRVSRYSKRRGDSTSSNPKKRVRK